MSARTVALGIAVAASLALIPLAAGAERGTLRPEGTPTVAGMQVLAGNLHNHSTDSDGDAPSDEIAAWLFSHRQELGLDYGSFTEHSDGFPATYGPAADTPDRPTAVVDQFDDALHPWARTAGLSAAYDAKGFPILRGFEWTNDQQNHLNVIGSANWTSRFVTGDAAFNMTPFWEWLSTQPATTDPTGAGAVFGGADGIGQFNHPRSKGPLNWDDFALHEGAAEQMATIEVDGNESGWYWFALSRGWTVAPVGNWDFHDWDADGILSNDAPGTQCGGGAHLPCHRALVLAQDNTAASLMEALRARRAGAAELPDLWATLRVGETWQGSTITAAPGETVTLRIDAGAQAHQLASVEIISDHDDVSMFYGDNVDCPLISPSPEPACEVDQYEHSQHTPSYLLQDIRYEFSGGNATVKAGFNDAPPAASVTIVPLEGSTAQLAVDVAVPSTPSTRPDGKHFLYAIVRTTTGHRAWTSPIFIQAP